VHAPKLEKEFVKKGFGVLRKEIMYNKFVIVGPKEDKAGIKNLNRQGIKSSVVDAFKKIARKRCLFISRGDNSGTHQKELDIWKQAGIFPRGTWYRETGQGMQETLIIADEKGAYCLVDKATFLLNEDKIDLVILFEKDPCLKNIYSVMATNPALHPHVRYKEAALFINWLSTEGKILIKNFRKRGKILFYCCD
jgi:tungstate transport system substrate-binding protein